MTVLPARAMGRLADALRKADLPDASGEHPGPRPGDGEAAGPGSDALLSRFVAELEALTGRAYVVAGLTGAVAAILSVLDRIGERRVLSWDPASPDLAELCGELSRLGVRFEQCVLPADPAERTRELGRVEPIQAGLTGSLAGLADTGSIVIEAGPGRGRLPSLLPPVHIAVLSRERLYGSLPTLLAADAGLVGRSSNLVIVTGPSRTADIEMKITHGVHGPRELHVVVVP